MTTATATATAEPKRRKKAGPTAAETEAAFTPGPSPSIFDRDMPTANELEFSAPRKQLLAAVKLAAAACSTRDIKPILKMVRLTALEHERDAGGRQPAGTVLVFGTDLDCAVVSRCDGVTTSTTGTACVDAELLTSALDKLTNDTVKLELNTEHQRLMVSDDYCELEFPAAEAKDFPDPPRFVGRDSSKSAYCKVMAGVLRDLFARTKHAVSNNGTAARFATSGINTLLASGQLTLQAYSGVIAVNASGPAPFQNAKMPCESTVVPTQFFSLLNSSHTGDNQQVELDVCFCPNEILARSDRVLVSHRLIEGRFPDLKKLLSDSTRKVKATLNTTPAALLRPLRQAGVVAEDVWLNVERDGEVVIEGKDGGRGNVQASVTLGDKDEVDGEDRPLLRLSCFAAGLSVLPGDAAIKITTAGNGRAVIVEAPDYDYWFAQQAIGDA